ncbi:MAG TPA: tRNA (adenosine(37)-N6)-threonylcarbamoyltransferase complex dimerization subunit type 1 TsaB [Arenimonas sp.]|nr:tRNA (adenosine(37)-N6)-threonylcarbamoyltransferase complex dimerization subunit type 1 TsaB [Arenimonas sp.]
MNLLAIETATEACSVALLCHGEVRSRFEIAPRRHTELVLPWCEALLAEAGIAKSQLDAIAVGRGPGAFTGVRLAVALVQGMALALERPVLPVSTLAVLAQGAQAAPGSRVLAAIDARMGEVYLGAFAVDGEGRVAALGDEVLCAPAQPPQFEGQWLARGTGFAAVEGALCAALSGRLDAVDAGALPRADDLLALAAAAFARGEAIAPDLLEPAYLRDKVALSLAEQRAARG